MNILIIQARLGSSRLPKKVLTEIEGQPLLSHLLNRLSGSKLINKCVVATTTEQTDDSLVDFFKKNEINYFRGSENDVLDRFYKASVNIGAKSDDNIIRICADNPLHHHEVLDFVLNKFIEGEYDYFSNSNYEPDFLEDGFDVEVFKFWLLEKAWNEAKLKSEREHVCPYMKKPEQFKCGWLKFDSSYNHKLSVDTEDDLNAIKAIYKELYHKNPNFSYNDVKKILIEKPEILALNKNSIVNSGYHNSLKEDNT